MHSFQQEPGAPFSGGVHHRGPEPQDWYAAYYRTYIERDVRELVNISNLDAFQRFIRLCVGRSGQLLDLSSLAPRCEDFAHYGQKLAFRA